MVRLIAEVHGKKIIMTKLFDPMLRLLSIDILNKVFCDLTYAQVIADKVECVTFKQSIRLTENVRVQ